MVFAMQLLYCGFARYLSMIVDMEPTFELLQCLFIARGIYCGIYGEMDAQRYSASLGSLFEQTKSNPRASITIAFASTWAVVLRSHHDWHPSVVHSCLFASFVHHDILI
jgi:hypothetical protein